MRKTVELHKKNGAVSHFPHYNTPDESCKSYVRYAGGHIIVMDRYNIEIEIAFPADDIIMVLIRNADMEKS